MFHPKSLSLTLLSSSLTLLSYHVIFYSDSLQRGDRQFIEFIEFIDYLNIVYIIYTFTSYYRKHTKAFLLFPVFCYL